MCGVVIKALDCGVRGHRFESNQLHLGRVFLQAFGFPSQERLQISITHVVASLPILNSHLGKFREKKLSYLGARGVWDIGPRIYA